MQFCHNLWSQVFCLLGSLLGEFSSLCAVPTSNESNNWRKYELPRALTHFPFQLWFWAFGSNKCNLYPPPMSLININCLSFCQGSKLYLVQITTCLPTYCHPAWQHTRWIYLPIYNYLSETCDIYVQMSLTLWLHCLSLGRWDLTFTWSALSNVTPGKSGPTLVDAHMFSMVMNF